MKCNRCDLNTTRTPTGGYQLRDGRRVYTRTHITLRCPNGHAYIGTTVVKEEDLSWQAYKDEEKEPKPF